MREPFKFANTMEQLRPGWYLAYDAHDRDWSFWEATEDADFCRIDWAGYTQDVKSDKSWSTMADRVTFYPIPEAMAPGIIMGAMHVSEDVAAWFRFAARIAQRECQVT